MLDTILALVQLEPEPISVTAPTQRAPLTLVPPVEEPAPDTVRTPPPVPPEPRTFEGTWTKLNSGGWGLLVQGACQVGDVVRARRKTGTLAVVRVGRVVLRSANPDITVCEVAR